MNDTKRRKVSFSSLPDGEVQRTVRSEYPFVQMKAAFEGRHLALIEAERFFLVAGINLDTLSVDKIDQLLLRIREGEELLP